MSEIITASLTVSGGDTIAVNLNTLARGPAGTGGSGAITSATTSDGTANLSISNVTTATATVSGIMTAPTAATTTSTTQVATTAFVQQELASGVAVAKNLEFLAHNGSGATIAKGSIVYINGAVSGVPRITKAQGNNDTNSARTIGVVKADIADGANGFVIIEGELQNVSTADSIGIIGAGIQLYLSPTTPGAFTRTKPSAPNHLVYVGVVVTASTGANLDGKILVGIQNGYELNEIHDVSITTPAAKQVIKRNAGNTLWINEAIVSADVSDATSAATANTLVLRDASGGSTFLELYANDAFIGDLNTSGGIQADGPIIAEAAVTFQGTSSITFDTTSYTYGAGAASAHRTALGATATGDALFTASSPAAANATLGRLTVVKTADEVLTNALLGTHTLSTDFAADSQLVIPLEANTLYRIEWGLLATSPNVELLKARFIYPARSVTDTAGGAISSGAWGNSSPTNHNGGATTFLLANHVGASQVRGNIGMMSLNIGATPGNLKLEWGKVVAGTGNTTMLKDSYLIATKIA